MTEGDDREYGAGFHDKVSVTLGVFNDACRDVRAYEQIVDLFEKDRIDLNDGVINSFHQTSRDFYTIASTYNSLRDVSDVDGYSGQHYELVRDRAVSAVTDLSSLEGLDVRDSLEEGKGEEADPFDLDPSKQFDIVFSERYMDKHSVESYSPIEAGREFSIFSERFNEISPEDYVEQVRLMLSSLIQEEQVEEDITEDIFWLGYKE